MKASARRGPPLSLRKTRGGAQGAGGVPTALRLLYHKRAPGAAESGRRASQNLHIWLQSFIIEKNGTGDGAAAPEMGCLMARRDKINYYLDIADAVSRRGTCLRRNYGAIIVKNDEILSTGYVGAPRGRKNCSDMGVCIREKLQIPRGERYELCRSVHAEANAIISAERKSMIGATLYLSGRNVTDGRYVELSLIHISRGQGKLYLPAAACGAAVRRCFAVFII